MNLYNYQEHFLIIYINTNMNQLPLILLIFNLNDQVIFHL